MCGALRIRLRLLVVASVALACSDRPKDIRVVAAPIDTPLRSSDSARRMRPTRMTPVLPSGRLGLRHVERVRVTSRGLVLQGDGVRLSLIDARGIAQWTHDLTTDSIVRVADLQVFGGDSIAVLDDRSERIVTLGSDGARVRTISTRRAGHIDAIAPFPGGRIIAVSSDPGKPLVIFDREGNLVNQEPFPDSWFMTLSAMARQGLVTTDERTGRWVFAPVFGNRLSVLTDGGASAATGVRVAASPFPDVIRIERGATVEERLGRAVLQVFGVAVRRSDILVLTRTQDGSARVVDRYRMVNAAYVDSFQVPTSASDLTSDGVRVYVLLKSGVSELHPDGGS